MFFQRVTNKLKRLLGIKQTHQNYWDQRASHLGARSVVSVKDQHNIDEITRYQEEKIFPILIEHLTGNEKTILDFGCGSGRFTSRLATITGAKAIGADSTKALIDIAKQQDPATEFLVIKNNKLPFKNNSIDIIWICLVLGGIPKNNINAVASEIDRVLSNNGLLILIENTSRIPDSTFWTYRPAEDYIRLFDTISLKASGSYKEVDEDITIMAGRKTG